jgi:hypothetical protein
LTALSRFPACAAVALLAGFPFFGECARAETPVPLSPHKAVYELSLLKGAGAKAPMQARGRIAFDFSGSACEGYVQNFRQITELQPEEGATRLSDLQSATFESGDGAAYRFKIGTKIDDGAADDIDGSAQKGKSAQVAVELTKPRRKKLDLGGPVLFPTEHMRRILAEARAGNRILEARVYDGSGDGSKIFETMTVIGAPLAVAVTEKPVQSDVFKNMRRWPVSISYFDSQKKDERPEYVLSFELFENGVSWALKLDYGDFVLNGEMTKLTLLPTPKCDK